MEPVDKLLDIGVVLRDNPVIDGVFLLRINGENLHELTGVGKSNWVIFLDNNDWLNRVILRGVFKTISGHFSGGLTLGLSLLHAKLVEKILREELVGKLVNVHVVLLNNPVEEFTSFLLTDL